MASLEKVVPSDVQGFDDFVCKLEPKIGMLGGRFFEYEGVPFKLNEIVQIFTSCVENSENITIDKTIFRKIRELDQEAFNKLNNSNIFVKILTIVRQFLGNLFYNREKALAGLEFPDKTPVTSRGEYRLLMLDGDGGTVACRVRGICLSTLFHFSSEGTIENALRSFLRLRNLAAVRGDVSGTRMIGPCDYYGNIEKPHKYLYTIDIDDKGNPVILRAGNEAATLTKAVEASSLSDQDIKTTVKAKWFENSRADICEVRRKYEREDRPVVGRNIFPQGGILEIYGTEEIKLKRFDARQLDLTPFKARLVDNAIPFQLTTEILPPSDEFRAISYLFEPDYASKEVRSGGGITLETHTFSQTMTPLDQSSAGFVTLGKWSDDLQTELDIIGVEIPFGYTLIVDKESIHGDATLSGMYMMLMTSNHTTMQTADCVYLKNAETLGNVPMTIEGDDPQAQEKGRIASLPIVAYRVFDSEQIQERFQSTITTTRVIKNILRPSAAL